ncbi:MAG: DUF4174 domain-containing protein [Bacteroidota bacterium]
MMNLSYSTTKRSWRSCFQNLLILVCFMLCYANVTAQLAKHRWQDRVILVFAAAPTDSLFQQQIQHLEQDMAGLEERDLVIYQLLETQAFDPKQQALDKKVVEQLRKKYEAPIDVFTTILIGKDGGEKLRVKYKILDRELLYATIDAMPMRRAEMKRKKQ